MGPNQVLPLRSSVNIHQSSGIIATSPWDYLVSYQGRSLEGSYPSAEK